jgi:hypothetical protein
MHPQAERQKAGRQEGENHEQPKTGRPAKVDVMADTTPRAGMKMI